MTRSFEWENSAIEGKYSPPGGWRTERKQPLRRGVSLMKERDIGQGIEEIGGNRCKHKDVFEEKRRE